MDDFKLQILKSCCDRLGLTLNTSVTYSMNDHFCSIVIDGMFICASNGQDLFGTIKSTVTKAMRIIDQTTDFQSRHVVQRTIVDFDTELRRILPVFENFITKLKERANNSYHHTHLTPPIDTQNYYSTKSYNTTVEPSVSVKLEPRAFIVVNRNMLLSNNNSIDKNNIGFQMLLGLGWTGGPLGANQNGIPEPLSVESRSNRRGLGTVGNINYSRFFDFLKEYANNDQQFDVLEFGDDFSFKEKNKLYGISKALNLLYVTERRNGMLVIKIMKPQ